MLGGHKGVSFTLTVRLELSDEERELVARYKLDYYPVLVPPPSTPSKGTIASLVTGESQTLSDVTTLVHNERIVKEACDDLPLLFDVVRSFGGEEVIDYPRELSSVD